jgi:maleylacetoacetate isomerase
MEMTLYHYWRSSCSWRVRLSLEFKGLSWNPVSVNLLEGAQKSDEHLKRIPSGTVPVLAIKDAQFDEEVFLQDSTAILEWLEENYPEKPLIPNGSIEKARVRYLCQIISSGIQPIQNLKVLHHVDSKGLNKKEWGAHWIESGFNALENALSEASGKYSFGDTITLSDFYLIPQCYNANRFGVDLSKFPNINRINESILSEEFSKKAHPDHFAPDNS